MVLDIAERVICETCGIRQRRSRVINNKRYWRKQCDRCDADRRGKPISRGNATISPNKRPLHLSGILLHTCSRCGWFGFCDAHHKNGNGHNEPENLVILCPNCHRDAHQGKPDKTPKHNK